MSLRKIERLSNVALADYTTIKIGGKAKEFFVANSLDDLKGLISDLGKSFYLLGKGSNLLVNDEFLKCPVVKLGKAFDCIREDKKDLYYVGAATPFSHLARYCLDRNLGGLEALTGIPATFGGMLFMNAASFGGEISSSICEVKVMLLDGSVKVLGKSQIDFSYRQSSFKDCIILGARINLTKENLSKQKIASFLKSRIESQDLYNPSCGCVFKNPDKFSAGFLIDSCNLKGKSKGKASVSQRHANFIVNLGGAKYADVDYLINKIKDQVYKKYSIILEEEIKRWID